MKKRRGREREIRSYITLLTYTLAKRSLESKG